MAIKYIGKQQFKCSFEKILKELLDSENFLYEINMREEKINGIYERIEIEINKVGDIE